MAKAVGRNGGSGGGGGGGGGGDAKAATDEEVGPAPPPPPPQGEGAAAAAEAGGGASSSGRDRLAAMARHAFLRYNDPEAWFRPNDQKKTLPDQWRYSNSRWRYLQALLPYLGPPSRALSRVWPPLLSVMLLCASINFAEGKISWNLDQLNNFQQLYRLSSFVLSLLLAFRANRTYDRWWSARSAFGGIGGGLVNLVRLIATLRPDDVVLIRQCQKWSLCMVYGMLQLIREAPKEVDPRVVALLEPDELALYTSTTKPSKLAGTMLSVLVHGAGFDAEREVLIEQILGSVAANVSMVVRIKLQAMPYAMGLFCTGYTYIWLLLLPFGVFPEASWSALLPVFVMSVMMLSLDDLTRQLEDPFRFIPYEPMVATTAKDMPRTVQEVYACQAMQREKYASLRKLADPLAAMRPWPPTEALGPRKQQPF